MNLQIWRLALAGAMLAPAPLAAQAPDAPSPAAKPADVRSADAILAALYDVISGPAGDRDWDRLRSLFSPGARLIPVAKTKDGVVARVLSVEDYIKAAAPAFKSSGFYEREVSRRFEEFAGIAHVFSTYESRRALGEAPFARGINSIQLLNDGKRWWIVTIYWDQETKDVPIPAKYLKPPGDNS